MYVHVIHTGILPVRLNMDNSQSLYYISITCLIIIIPNIVSNTLTEPRQINKASQH